MRITLDAETFKALASSSRLQVLKALDERRKTLSELARDLALNKATVHEHLALLSSADLVKKRDDEGRKWIYYELTWRGQKILHPQETTSFNILLGLSVLAAGGGAALLVRSLLAARDEATLLGDLEASDATPLSDGTEGQKQAQDASASGEPAAAGAPAPESAPADRGVAESTVMEDTPVDDSGLLGEGGALALAILAAGALLGLLATLLRFRLRPKKPQSPGLE
ncbi:MAG: winged helix-turn-helix domain-containing protein [Candidatus Thermoplasmatota archaeon]